MPIERALVVDDSKLARLTLTKLLKKKGLQVDSVMSGVEALEYLKEQKADVIFMDYMMPEMDGLEATRRICSGETTSHLPVVMCTAQDTPEDRERAKDCGARGYLIKPASLESLGEVIQSINQLLVSGAKAAEPAAVEAAPVEAAASGTADISVIRAEMEKAVAAITKKVAEQVFQRLANKMRVEVSQAAEESAKQAAENTSIEVANRVAKEVTVAVAKETAQEAAESAAREVAGDSARSAATEVAKKISQEVGTRAAEAVVKQVLGEAVNSISESVSKDLQSRMAKQLAKAVTKDMLVAASQEIETRAEAAVSRAVGAAKNTASEALDTAQTASQAAMEATRQAGVMRQETGNLVQGVQGKLKSSNLLFGILHVVALLGVVVAVVLAVM